MGARWGEVWVLEAGGTYYGGCMFWLSDQALIKTLKVNVTTCVALLWERGITMRWATYQKTSTYWGTRSPSRWGWEGFPSSELTCSARWSVGRSVGITRLRNIQHTSTNETIPFYKTLPNIQYICILLQMKSFRSTKLYVYIAYSTYMYVYVYKWNHPCSTLLYPYHTNKHILHDMAYFHWWNNPQSVLKLSHTSTDWNIESDQKYSITCQEFNREKC